jgi:S1-C subfamily serine protease
MQRLRPLRIVTLIALGCLSATTASPVAAQTTSIRTGTGFAISRSTHIVTNAHVVARCEALRVHFGSQVAYASVLALDEGDDLAVLQTQLVLPKIIAVRGSPALRLGESVVAFGFPLTGSLSLEGNLTTGNVSALAGLGDDPKYLQITAPVQPGNSGGPLLDESGNLIGVITAKLDAMAIAKRTGDIPQNVNFAIKTEVVEAFLKSAGVRYERSVSDRPLQVTDIADIAKAAAVRIECSPSAGADKGPTRIMPPVERTSPSPAPPIEMRKGPPPVASDTEQEQLLQQVQIVEVRTPYPGTAPALRSVVIFNGSANSIYRITLGWLNNPSARQCPASGTAYDGQKDVFVSVPSGKTSTTMADFPEQAKLFCVLGVLTTPTPRAPDPEPGR